MIGGRDFRLADEVRYIQRQAADQHGCIVTVGQLILFATETGDAWLLDPADRLAARLARDGESEPIHIEETESPSVGRGAIASTDPPSSMPITIAAE
jgi:hypothetical protein